MHQPRAKPSMRRRLIANLPVLVVLMLAAGLRWWQPGWVEFKYDEAHITGMAMEIAAGESWPLLSGGTSLGLQRSALDAYLLAIPLALTGGRVEAAIWFTGALGVAAVALVYVLGRRIAGRRAALVASLYLAANPWLILYDRKLWAHVQVVLSVALLLLAWNVVVRRDKRSTFWFPVLASLQLLTHTLALVQGLSWLAAILVAPKRWRTRRFGWGILVGLILLVPYGWGLLGWLGSGLASLDQASGFVGSAVNGGQPLLERLAQPSQLFAGWGIDSLMGMVATSPAWSPIRLAGLLSIFLLMTGIIRTALWLRKPERKLTAQLLLAWGLGPTLAFLVAPSAIYLQYWTILLPLPALFFALGIDGLLDTPASSSARRYVAGVGWVIVVGIVLAWIAAYANVLGQVQSGAGAAAFGVPLQKWQQAMDVAASAADDLNLDQIRVAVSGVDPAQDGDAAVVAALIGSPPFARFVAPKSPAALLLSDAQDSLYFWALDSPEGRAELDALGERLWQGELAAGRPPAILFHLPKQSPDNLTTVTLKPPVAFDLGVELLGFNFPQEMPAGQGFEIALVWRVTDPAPDVRTRDFTAFNHIVNGKGEMAAQADGMALLSRDWWPGDILVQPYRVALPAGEYTWRAGLYSRIDGGRAQRLDDGDAVEVQFTVGEN
ncbi:MAG: glycosyltransferase family 39 protein [Caldilineales bacterium]|nr:glycosyltransferase family 39 protein [Caldilineales bacterium]